MSSWISVSDSVWFEKWDLFLKRNDCSFINKTERIASYEKFGFHKSLLLLTKDDEIIAGALCVMFKVPLFKIFICPYGPIGVSASQKSILSDFVSFFDSAAQKYGCMASQLTLSQDFYHEKFQSGKIFSRFPSYEKVNLVRVNSSLAQHGGESIIDGFTKKARRDVRLSIRKGLESRVARKQEEIRLAYKCIEDNANNKGYSVRSWESFGEYLLAMIECGDALMLAAYHENEIQGAILLERSSSILHYTMGGVYRHTPDLCTGYFLQFKGMELASELGCAFYDVSCGGPAEVVKFKNSFNPEETRVGYTQSRIYKKPIFRLYNSLVGLISKFVLPFALR